jgi:hypothetical protein
VGKSFDGRPDARPTIKPPKVAFPREIGISEDLQARRQFFRPEAFRCEAAKEPIKCIALHFFKDKNGLQSNLK